MNEQKSWFLSKTVITSGVAFAVAVAATAGLIDEGIGTRIQALLIPLIFAFLRFGNQELV